MTRFRFSGLVGCLLIAAGCSQQLPNQLAQVAVNQDPAAPQAGAGVPGAAEEQLTAEKARSPIVKALLTTLEGMAQEGSDEEKKLIRQILHDADEELANSLGKNSLKRIQDANRRRRAFYIPTGEQHPEEIRRDRRGWSERRVEGLDQNPDPVRPADPAPTPPAAERNESATPGTP